MKRDLGLTDEQAGQIRAILDETRSQYRAARAAAGQRIRALLTPEQQQKFDAKKAERDARRGRDGGGR
jgi:Spy/CpxP family protein refolding chaperone